MIQSIIAKIPNLHIYGVGRAIGSGFLTDSKFSDYQENLLKYDKNEFNKICEWLATKEKTKRLNKKTCSYKLKHIVEKELGFYIPNGAFIAAAIHSGFEYKIDKNYPNVFFKIKI